MSTVSCVPSKLSGQPNAGAGAGHSLGPWARTCEAHCQKYRRPSPVPVPLPRSIFRGSTVWVSDALWGHFRGSFPFGMASHVSGVPQVALKKRCAVSTPL